MYKTLIALLILPFFQYYGPTINQPNLMAPQINGFFTIDGSKYATLNQAWTAALASGQPYPIIQLGPGTYPVTATLVEPVNSASCVSIVSSGSQAEGTSANQVNISFPSSLGGDFVNMLNAAGTRPEGCRFSGFNILGNKNITHCFEFQYGRGIVIDHISCQDTTGDGIVLGSNSNPGNAMNFHISDTSVSWNAGLFTPATRGQYGVHLNASAVDSTINQLVCRNPLYACVLNASNGNDMISYVHSYGYPYTCSAGSATATISTTNGSTAATVTATGTGTITQNQMIVAAGVPFLSTVGAIAGSALTLSANATATASGVASTFVCNPQDASAADAAASYASLYIIENTNHFGHYDHIYADSPAIASFHLASNATGVTIDGGFQYWADQVSFFPAAIKIDAAVTQPIVFTGFVCENPPAGMTTIDGTWQGTSYRAGTVGCP